MAIDVTFGGQPCHMPGPNRFELALGVAPSRGAVTMTETNLKKLTLLNTAHVLRINDGTRTLPIKDLYVTGTEATAPVKSGENMVTIRFEDKRSLFQWKNVSGVFNKLNEDGSTFRAGTVRGIVPFTFDQIIQVALDTLGAGITAATGIAWTPENVEWELAPAAAALSALLSEVGWDIALKPDGTFELVDLKLGAGGAFRAPTGLTELSHTIQRRDVAHARPKKVRVGLRIMRRRSFSAWEAVLQDDGDKRALGNDIGQSPTAQQGIWRRASTVLRDWGTSLAEVEAGWYAKQDPQNQASIINKLGGGDVGASRWRRILGQLYKFWRLTDTDRPVILPLVPIGADVNTDPGHETAAPAWCFLAQWHVMRRDNQGGGAAFFENKAGAPPWQVEIVDAKDGVVGFKGSGVRPLAKVDKLPGKLGFGPHDFRLRRPVAPSITVAFYKKQILSVPIGAPTTPTTPAVILSESDYHFVEKNSAGGNNGETKTFLADHTIVTETLVAGSFVLATGRAATWANAFLDAWLRQFDVPDPEEFEFAGVDPAAKLTGTVRGIAWDFSRGVTSRYRLNTDTSLDRYGLGRSAREKSKAVSLAAESARLVRQSGHTVSALAGAPSSPFGGTPPALVDFSPDRDATSGFAEHYPHFLNDELAGLLVAEDWRMGESGESCEKDPQTSGGPSRGQISGRAGATNQPRHRKSTVTSGGGGVS